MGVAIDESGGDQTTGEVKFGGASGNQPGKLLGRPNLLDAAVPPPYRVPGESGLEADQAGGPKEAGSGESHHAENIIQGLVHLFHRALATRVHMQRVAPKCRHGLSNNEVEKQSFPHVKNWK
jgi:hypothetical protein